MTWGFAAAAGVAAASSLISSSSAGRSAAKQAGQMSKAENEAIERNNINAMIRNHYKAGMLNMQLGAARKEATQGGFNTTVQARQAMGMAVANQAAVGAVGASADIVKKDIEMKLGEAQAQAREDYEVTVTNYNNELAALSESARTEVQYERKYEYNGPSGGQMLGGALLAGITSFAGNYASRSMKLGLGDTVSASAGTMGGLGSGIRGGLSTPNFAGLKAW